MGEPGSARQPGTQARRKASDLKATNLTKASASRRSSINTSNQRPDVTPTTSLSLALIQTQRLTDSTSGHESDQLIYSASTPNSPSTTFPSTTTSHANNLLHPRNPSEPIPFRPTMSTLQPLPQPAEDDLHAKRLLNIEEKSYKRVQKRLLAPSNPIQEFLRRPAVDSHSNGTTTTTDDAVSSSDDSPSPASYLTTLQTFHHQTLHDFTALSLSLARLQLLLDSNTKERARYAAQASQITTQHATIKANNGALRTRLTEAREQLEVRKGYDVLAEKVLYVDGRVGGERAKTREELGRESEKLRGEIEELEKEGVELGFVWRERREVLGGVVAEAARLRRVVRGEGLEGDAERAEEDDSEDEGEKTREDEDELLAGQGRREGDGESNVGTPRDDGGATPMPDHGVESSRSGGMTPLHSGVDGGSGGMTPRSGLVETEDGGATPRPHGMDGGSGLKNEMQLEGGDDAPMADGDNDHEESTISGIPEVRVDDAEKAEVSEMDTS